MALLRRLSTSGSSAPAASFPHLALPLGEDPVAVLDAAVWAMAACVRAQRQALSEPLADVLASDPARTVVLKSVALVRPGPDGLDVGTGVGAPALTPAESFVRAPVDGIDVLERALELGRAQPAAADPDVAARASPRLQDAADASEPGAYEPVRLPAPFLSEAALRARPAPARRGPGAGSVAGSGDHPRRR
ncbi:hypothetical protein [Streptomyces sp. NPDC059894]|uniref:hypothetical protein n=1 Tax=unclassified Streptomyces TaxID=2593676 RepID=UPI0036561E8C